MKQKGLRKLVSMILAVVMVLSMSATAFATTVTYGEGEGTYEGEITISGAVKNEMYSVYQMLELSYDGESAYTYSAVNEWVNFFSGTGAGATYFDYNSTTGYVTLKSDYVDDDGNCTIIAAQLESLAKDALTYATTNSISKTASGTADDEGISFVNLPLGYYLVDTSLGTLCSIDTTDKKVKIQEKNTVPTVKKEETTDGTAGIGDTVEYKVTISDAANISNLTYHDIMSSGLTFNEDDVTVKVGNTRLTEETDYEVVTTHIENEEEIDGCEDDCTFEIIFKVVVTGDVTITYSATVNTNAIIDGEDKENGNNSNKGSLSYGEKGTSEWDIVYTDVYDIDIYKYTTDSGNNKVALSGANFVLYKNVEGEQDGEGNPTYIKYYAVVNENGKLSEWTSTEGNAEVLTSDSNGKIAVDGLDAGTYYLLETSAPAGYNKLTSTITVEVEENGNVTYSYGEEEGTGTINVENNAGSELPSTGGMGTKIFYVVGSVLVLGAAVLFVTKKRLGGEN